MTTLGVLAFGGGGVATWAVYHFSQCGMCPSGSPPDWPATIATGGITVLVGGLILVGGIAMVQFKIKPFRVWRRSEARALTQSYNEHQMPEILDAFQGVSMEVLLKGNGVMLRGRF